MIVFSHACVEKDGRVILDDISLSLTEKRVGIIGDNGSGKSTLAKLINGLETCASGHVMAAGKPASWEKVGFVFQNPENQIVYPFVDEDLAFGLKKSGLSKGDIDTRISELLAAFDLEDLRKRRTHELSGGEKQMIALMGVLVMTPDIIVLDEPTTLLDLRNRSRLVALLDALPQQLVIVSHDLDLMAKMERVVRIENGRVADDGAPETVIANYRKASEKSGA